MQHRAPTRADHQQFCDNEGWSPALNARAQSVGHHLTLTLELADGRILRTRISRPVNRTNYAPSMFKHIIRDQLECTVDDFFACVDHATLPPRPQLAATPKTALPLYVAQQLREVVGVPHSTIATLGLAEALELLAKFYVEQEQHGS